MDLTSREWTSDRQLVSVLNRHACDWLKCSTLLKHVVNRNLSFIVRLYIWAATSSRCVFALHPPNTHNPLHTFRFTKTNYWKINRHWAPLTSLCNAMQVKACYMFSCHVLRRTLEGLLLRYSLVDMFLMNSWCPNNFLLIYVLTTAQTFLGLIGCYAYAAVLGPVMDACC